MAQRRVSVVLDAAVQGFQRGMQQARQQTQQFGQSLERNAASMTRLGLGMTAAATAIGLAIRSTARESAEFEATLMRMRTQIGLTEQEAREMGETALELRHTGRGAQELGDALWFAGSAGLRGQEAMDAVEASAKAAAIGLGETGTVVDLVTSAMNAYGSEVLDAEAATDVLVGAVREGKAEAPQLAASMGMVLPIASEMGVRFDEVGAAIAAMTKTGTDAGTASMQLRQILAALLNPAQGVQQAMEEMGLSADRVRSTIREDGLWQAMMDLRDATQGNDEALGRLFPNVRALAGFLDLTGANAEKNAQVFEALADTTGLLNDGFEQWGETTEASQQRFSAALEAAKITAGEDFQPAMRSLLDTGTGLLETFMDLDPAVRRFGSQAAIATTAALGLGGSLLTTAGSTALLVASLKNMGVTMAGIRAAAINPYTAALAASAAVVTAWISSTQRGRDAAREFADEVHATSETHEEASARIRNELARLEEQSRRAGGTMGFGLDGRSLRENAAQLAELRREMGRTEESFSLLQGRWNEPFTNPFRDPTGGAQDLTGAFGDLEDAVDEATSALSRHEEQLRAMTDPIFGVMSASQNLEDAMSNLDETQGDTEASAEDLAVAERDVAEAAIELLGRMGELDGALEDGTLTVDGLRNALQPLVDSGLIPQSVFDRLIDDFDETTGMVWDYIRATDNVPPDLETVIRLHGANDARLTLLEFGRLLDDINRDVRIRLHAEGYRVSPGVEIRHRGGRVGMDPAPTTTLTSPMNPNERLILAEVGERVVTEHQWHAMTSPTVQVMHSGGVVGGGPLGTVNHFHFPNYVGDRRELVDAMTRGLAERAHDNAGVG